jgi:pimeloyl-ACP methyl ester carboxylesterase
MQGIRRPSWWLTTGTGPSCTTDAGTYADDLAEVIEKLDLRDIILAGHSPGVARWRRLICVALAP